MIRIALATLLVLLTPGFVLGQAVVVPTDRVVNGVSIRASATTASTRIGTLLPGESAVFMGEVPNWYHIDYAGHGTGFVSKSWTRVVTDSADASNETFDVYVVDVATGLAIFVHGQDFNLVYDAGSNDDLAGNRFLDFLNEVVPNTTTIDHLLISHAHRDHISMLPGLLEATQVEHIWDSGVVYPSCTYQTLLERIADEGARYHTAVHDIGQHDVAFNTECANTGNSVNVTFASRISTGAVQLGNNSKMTFLHVDGSPRNDLNENSLVVMLELGEIRILLTGDAGGGQRRNPTEPPDEGSVERALIDCCSDTLSADILILGHHGSMTSSRDQFVDAVEARDFIVSSGPKKYGSVVLPDSQVVELVKGKPNTRPPWRTDVEDDDCKVNPDKIGNDNDNRAGGCSNIHIRIPGASERYDIKVL